MKTILFQGDSITDCNRSRENDFDTGTGYACGVIQSIAVNHPGEYQFFNRGISGDRIVDVYARIKCDIINLKPDYMSLLIGVNDVWHELSRQNGICVEKFEKLYDMLISEILEELPNIKILLMGAYLVKGPATEEKWDVFSSEVAKRAEITKKLAEKYNLKYIPLQDKFDEMCRLAPAQYWTGDGVHPTTAGHGIIVQEWLKAFEDIK